ncbi:hypothetical protein [Vibrio cholerae]|uniref:hypothetical protein n=1 Tax=Vibrio cholerae TaxID=666 RepID=UPI001159620D|nr:hypothetical protein [Vibrio cholerae]TQP65516.1 hypothetical protein FLL91_19170 [Vibrio cholerae]TQQ02625.1 hypothetical protein FLL72_17900 [Vibrio cholerae]
MKEFEDLERVAPGIGMLDTNDHIAIQRFTITWSIFEAKFLSYFASVSKICERVDALEADVIDKAWFKDELDYFKNRYIDEHGFTRHFEKLNLRKNDNQPLVEAVLTGKNNDLKDQLKACLIIVYRYRNNLFHGDKWSYAIQGQQRNFNCSVELLKKCITQFRI